MRDDEEEHCESIIAILCCMREGNFWPACLNENLDKYELGTIECLKIGIIIITSILISSSILVIPIENLHSQYSQCIVGNQIKREELEDNG